MPHRTRRTTFSEGEESSTANQTFRPAQTSRGVTRSLEDPSFDRFFRESYARTVRLVSAVTGSAAAAEDAVHEAIAKAWERRGRIDHLEAWIVTVALNAARSRWRKIRREVSLDLTSNRPAEDCDNQPMAELRAAITALPNRQRQVVLMHYLLDAPIAEIATSLGLSSGAVKHALYSARQSLYQIMVEERSSHGR